MVTADLRRKGFESWLSDYKTDIFTRQDEDNLKNGLTRIGIDIPSIYSIDESFSVRLLASELTLKRTQCGIYDFDQYLRAVQWLIRYAEYLDIYKKNTLVAVHLDKHVSIDAQIIESSGASQNGGEKQNHTAVITGNHKDYETKELIIQEQSSDSKDDKSKDDALVIAYYLSRMDIKGVKELGYKNFSNAFKELGKILGRKPATIKNMRDEFDPFFDNPRAGWYQRPLRKSRLFVFNQFKTMTDSELTSFVKEIINRNRHNAENDLDETERTLNETERTHRRIIISRDTMREIKQNTKKEILQV